MGRCVYRKGGRGRIYLIERVRVGLGGLLGLEWGKGLRGRAEWRGERVGVGRGAVCGVRG